MYIVFVYLFSHFCFICSSVYSELPSLAGADLVVILWLGSFLYCEISRGMVIFNKYLLICLTVLYCWPPDYSVLG